MTEFFAGLPTEHQPFAGDPMNPTLRELLSWLRCPHRASMQHTNDDHIAWRCDDCGLSRVKWLPTKYRDA